MTRPEAHPEPDQVAELLEGTLDPVAERWVRAHLHGCDDCTALAGRLVEVSTALRAEAGNTPAMPADVAERLEGALAGEVRARQIPASGSSGAAVSSLTPRRVRRRRALAGGLLAAAAATVVAVGLGDLLGGTGTAEQAGVTGSAADTGSRAEQAPAQLHAGAGGGATAHDRPGPTAAQDGSELRGHTAFRALSSRNLIAVVTARHDEGSDRLDHPACVRSALGPGGERDAAAYAVRLPPDVGEAAGGMPGAVVLRPSSAPTEALLVTCSSEPRVVLRRPLGQGAAGGRGR